jgi:hypothetical protein
MVPNNLLTQILAVIYSPSAKIWTVAVVVVLEVVLVEVVVVVVVVAK